VLGLEEIGKVVLELWTQAGPLSKPIERRTSHVRKQAAVGSLLLASFAVNEFGDVEVDADVGERAKPASGDVLIYCRDHRCSPLNDDQRCRRPGSCLAQQKEQSADQRKNAATMV
jgi:hypothetical protein